MNRDNSFCPFRDFFLNFTVINGISHRVLISTNTGSAPTLLTASAVAIHVSAGTITSSPGPIFKDAKIISRASVPFPQPKQYSAPR